MAEHIEGYSNPEVHHSSASSLAFEINSVAHRTNTAEKVLGLAVQNNDRYCRTLHVLQYTLFGPNYGAPRVSEVTRNPIKRNVTATEPHL